MANSKERRKLRRELLDAGLWPPVQRVEVMTSGPKRRWYHSPLGKLAGLIGFAASVTGLAAALNPWLTIEHPFLYNPNDPFSQSFDVLDDGLTPIRNMYVECRITGTVNHLSMVNSGIGSAMFERGLTFHHRQALPCNEAIALDARPGAFDVSKKLELHVIVKYDLWWTHVTRSQDFYLQLTRGADLQFHWIDEG